LEEGYIVQAVKSPSLTYSVYWLSVNEV